jgi:hypothetical protein
VQLTKDERDVEAVEYLRLDPLFVKLESLGEQVDSGG